MTQIRKFKDMIAVLTHNGNWKPIKRIKGKWLGKSKEWLARSPNRIFILSRIASIEQGVFFDRDIDADIDRVKLERAFPCEFGAFKNDK